MTFLLSTGWRHIRTTNTNETLAKVVKGVKFVNGIEETRNAA